MTDGTVAGTVLLKDINPGAGSSSPFEFVQLGTKVLFFANNGTVGTELWITDGTSAGTTIVKDLRTGSASSVFNGEVKMLATNTHVFFWAYNNSVNNVLFSSDGTFAGTMEQIGYQNPTKFTKWGNKIYFTINAFTYTNLCYVDSGSTTPYSVTYYYGGTNVLNANDLTPANNKLYLTSGSVTGDVSLYIIYDYSPSSTTLVKDINGAANNDPFPSNANERKFYPDSDNNIYFLANDGVNGKELWFSDGNASNPTGTLMVRDFNTGTGDGTYSHFRILGNKLFFIAKVSSGSSDCWMTTSGGLTTSVKGFSPLLNIDNVYPIATSNNLLFFSAFNTNSGYELYSTNGITCKLVKDISTGLNSKNASNFQRSASNNNGLFFIADDRKTGLELWKTDGLRANTQLFYDFNSYPSLENPGNHFTSYDFYNTSSTFYKLFEYNNLIYIIEGINLWVTDGISPPTKILTNNKFQVAVTGFEALNGILYFNLQNELWKTNGTIAGTSRVAYADATIPNDYRSIYGLTAFNNKLYFAGYHNTFGEEVFVSDGTTANTGVFSELSPGLNSYSNLIKIRPVGNQLFISLFHPSEGFNLYKTDGIVANTIKLKTFGNSVSTPDYLTNYKNQQLVFAADDGISGTELWKSDGTVLGTTIIKDLNVGPNGVSPFISNSTSSFPVFNNNLFFHGYDSNGLQLFKSDLTMTGTEQLVPTGGAEILGTPFGVYFNAFIPQFGSEPHKIEDGINSLQLIEDINVGSGNSNPTNYAYYNKLIFMKSSKFNTPDRIYVYRTCLNNADFSGPQSTSVSEERLVNINSTNNIATGLNVNYLAKKSIMLNPGFSTSLSTIFNAQIGGCLHKTMP